MSEMNEFIAALDGLRKYYCQCHGRATLAFYSEGEGDWGHFEEIISHILENREQIICYLTSDATDPAFKKESDKFVVCYIGSGISRTLLFNELNCSVAVMTMPDLQTFHLKRSRHPVHYVYCFHSLNSTHMAYRSGAFDAYDIIFCVGPHHVEEIRAAEELYGLKRKTLVEVGYPRLDRLLRVADSQGDSKPAAKHAVVAPTWGSTSMVEHGCLSTLVSNLLSAAWNICLRLHPMTVRHRPELIDDLRTRFGPNPNFQLQLKIADVSTLMRASLMISDWSGAALEYGLAFGRPVLFINTPSKVRNPEYRRLNVVPFEVRLREVVGAVISTSALDQAPEVASALTAQNRESQVHALREGLVYNPRRSARVAADYLMKLTNQPHAITAVSHTRAADQAT